MKSQQNTKTPVFSIFKTGYLAIAAAILVSGCVAVYPAPDMVMGDNPAKLKIEAPSSADELDHYYLYFYSHEVVCDKPGITSAKNGDYGYLYYPESFVDNRKKEKGFPEHVFIPSGKEIVIAVAIQDTGFFSGTKGCFIGMQFTPHSNATYELTSGFEPPVTKQWGSFGSCYISIQQNTGGIKIPIQPEQIYRGSVTALTSQKYICHEDGTYEPKH